MFENYFKITANWVGSDGGTDEARLPMRRYLNARRQVMVYIILFPYPLFFFETGSHYIAQTGLELSL
jgi:hypothetical protein